MMFGEWRGEEDAMTESAFAGIERAIADVAAGRPVVVVDDEDRENEGDLIFAAAWATPELLADPDAQSVDFARPGHVVPLRAREGGVLRLPGHTEAGVDLARLAGLAPAVALCEIVSVKDPGEMARREELEVFAAEHDLRLISIADLIGYRRRFEKQSWTMARRGWLMRARRTLGCWAGRCRTPW
jgi:3,4-dihydroxy-2-butanone 4-phosphate synthase